MFVVRVLSAELLREMCMQHSCPNDQSDVGLCLNRIIHQLFTGTRAAVIKGGKDIP